MFQPGDIIRCVEPVRNLRKGDHYTVLSVSTTRYSNDSAVSVQEDVESISWPYLASRFQFVKQAVPVGNYEQRVKAFELYNRQTAAEQYTPEQILEFLVAGN